MLLGNFPDGRTPFTPTQIFYKFPMSVKKKPARKTRSISFAQADFDYVTRKAAALKRTFNWVVNELVRLDCECALPAAAGARKV